MPWNTDIARRVLRDCPPSVPALFHSIAATLTIPTTRSTAEVIKTSREWTVSLSVLPVTVEVDKHRETPVRPG